jgi:hypothetical protein
MTMKFKGTLKASLKSVMRACRRYKVPFSEILAELFEEDPKLFE